MVPLLLVLACGPTSGEVTVLTYNVKGLPDAASDLRPTEERLERISPFLDAYDLVGLQEVFYETYLDLVVAEASHPDQLWFSDVLEVRPAGSGLALLSTVERRVGYYEEHYTECYGILEGASDCLASKGFQVLRLSLGGAELDVYNTHHEAGGGEEDDAARASQVSQVLASLEGHSAGRAILFMGDTNLRPSDPEDLVELQRYEAVGLRDACTEVGCDEADHIDRFYLRDSEELHLEALTWSREAHLVDEEGADLSDHPGIAIDLAWSKP